MLLLQDTCGLITHVPPTGRVGRLLQVGDEFAAFRGRPVSSHTRIMSTWLWSRSIATSRLRVMMRRWVSALADNLIVTAWLGAWRVNTA